MKILVVDDMAIIREPMVCAFQGAGHDAVGAASGAEALITLKKNKPDLLVLDVQLPDISGLKILRAVRNTPETAQLPVILLTAKESRDSIITAASLGVQAYVLKSRFSMSELLTHIEKYVPKPDLETRHANPAARKSDEIPQLLTREQFLQLAGGVLSPNRLPDLVARVVSLATLPERDSAELAEFLGKDAAFASRVLKAAAQAGAGPIGDIAAAIGVFEAMPKPPADALPAFRCWRHSFAVARICQTLASAAGENPRVAYLIGMCHDLGEIVLHTLFSAEYRQLIEYSESSRRAREEIELRMLGMMHAELIGTILHSLGLPDAVRQPIERFHGSVAASTGSPGRLEGILRIAEWHANGILLASSETAELNLLSAAQSEVTLGTKDVPRPDLEKLREEIAALTGAQTEPLQPTLSASAKKIWIARDVPLSPLDSVSAALSALTNATLYDRLPTPTELASLDGLAVLGDRALQDGATALLHVARSSIPTLRICPAKSNPTQADALQCPITLADLFAFCASLTAQADSIAHSSAA